jgi:D-glycero-alpha-D-manno-heptose-7-phosphate kinase
LDDLDGSSDYPPDNPDRLIPARSILGKIIDSVIIVQTPLRISLFGGGTDFPDYFRAEGGSVVSSTIDKYIYVIIKERFDDQIRVSYTVTEIVNQVNDIKHELIREALKMSGIKKSVEVVTMGDIPAGTGLGSSSTVTVGALHAFHTYCGQSINMEKLAREACEIEVDILKKPIGYQDQYIASYGGLRFFEFHQDGSIGHQAVEIDPEILNQLSNHLMLIYSGTTRNSESILTKQKNNIHNNLTALNKLKEITREARIALTEGRLDEIGGLLHESWELKKSLAAGINNGKLGDIYQIARKAGALGGKVTGAGGGGFLMLYCSPDKKDKVRSALSHLKELPFRLEPTGSRVIFNHHQ